MTLTLLSDIAVNINSDIALLVKLEYLYEATLSQLIFTDVNFPLCLILLLSVCGNMS